MEPEWSLLASQKPFTEFNSNLDTGSLYYQILLIQYSFTFIIMFSVWILMIIL
jgi:hypothetical protein